MIALTERYRDERVLRGGAVGDATHLVGVDTHGLFHQERQSLIHEIERGLGHATVSAERDHEVGSGLRQHSAVVGEDRWTAQRGRPLRGDLRARVLKRHEPHVGHADDMA